MSGKNADSMIGPRIRRARQAAGLTQKQLAQMIGAHRDSVSNWETGKHAPDGNLPKIEEALDVTLGEGESERIAETFTLEAVLDRLRAAERELDRARAIVRHIVAEGSD